MSMRSAFSKLPKISGQAFMKYLKTRFPVLNKDSEVVFRSDFNSYEVCFDGHGDPEKVLTDRFVPVEDPVERQVKVKMLMSPVNASDLSMIDGSYFIQPLLPAVGGCEGVGEVLSVGNEAKLLRPGDWVIPVDPGMGTWRTLILENETELMKVPNDIPVLGAATVALNPCTAYRMLKSFVDLRPGDAIIQNGANSSVGQAVIQLAKAWGITTINIVRYRQNIDELMKYLRDLGADHVVTDKFLRSEDMRFFISSLPDKPRLALDCLGGRISGEMPQYLSDDAVMVTYGAMAHETAPQVEGGGTPMFRQVRVQGYWESTWDKDHGVSPTMEEMVSELCDMMREGRFHPPECDIYTLDMYQLAVRLAKEPFRRRKVVFMIGDDITM